MELASGYVYISDKNEIGCSKIVVCLCALYDLSGLIGAAEINTKITKHTKPISIKKAAQFPVQLLGYELSC